MTSGVYWIYQPSQDRAVYVGGSKDVEFRIKYHVGFLKRGKHDNPILQRTWNKYGISDFTFDLLEPTTLETLIEREQFWIDALSPFCNIALAAGNSMRGVKMSEAHRQKISAANKGMPNKRKGIPLDAEHRQKISDALTGRKRSQEGLDNIRAAAKKRIGMPSWNKGKKFSVEYRKKLSDAKKGKPSLRRGIKLSEEACQKMKEAHLGRKLSDEHKKRIGEGLIGRECTDEARQKISAANKAFWSKPENRERMREIAFRREAAKRTGRTT